MNWVVSLCSSERAQHSVFCPEDGGDIFFRHVGISNYNVLQPRIPFSSYSESPITKVSVQRYRLLMTADVSCFKIES